MKLMNFRNTPWFRNDEQSTTMQTKHQKLEKLKGASASVLYKILSEVLMQASNRVHKPHT